MTLSLEHLSVRYGERVALHPTSLQLAAREFVGLIGPNGAGKSSLLKAVAGVVGHDGAVKWRDSKLARLRPLERARTIAYLPQMPAAHWPMSAADLVALGRMPHRRFIGPPAASDAIAVGKALSSCDAEVFADRSVNALSGGERARVLLARALAVEAPVLLVDEPIQSLDAYHQLKIMDVLRDNAAAGVLVVAVLHDVALAARYCTRVVLLHDGRVVEDGTPEHVLTRAVLARYYRVEPYLARHEGEAVVMPWRQLEPRK